MRLLGCLVAAVLVVLLFSDRVAAEPYLAVREGYQCGTCHVSPSGGGMRNVFGNVYARSLLPAKTIGADNPKAFVWTGEMLDFLKAGANIRASERRTSVPGRADKSGWDLDRASLYLAVEPIVRLQTNGTDVTII